MPNNMDATIHNAATLTTSSNLNPDLDFQVNVLGSNNLLELTHQFGLKYFIDASSYPALGYRPMEECPVDVSFAPTPNLLINVASD